MRNHRDTVKVWTLALLLAIGLLIGLALLLTAPRASAHRPVSTASAISRANNAIRARRWNDGRSPAFCGHLNYKCFHVNAPIVKTGLHSYGWSGASFMTARCTPTPFGDLCWARRTWATSGIVNGHTGKVTINGRW